MGDSCGGRLWLEECAGFDTGRQAPYAQCQARAMAGVRPLDTLELEKRVEELLDERSFGDDDDWGRIRRATRNGQTRSRGMKVVPNASLCLSSPATRARPLTCCRR